MYNPDKKTAEIKQTFRGSAAEKSCSHCTTNPAWVSVHLRPRAPAYTRARAPACTVPRWASEMPNTVQTVIFFNFYPSHAVTYPSHAVTWRETDAELAKSRCCAVTASESPCQSVNVKFEIKNIGNRNCEMCSCCHGRLVTQLC